MLLTTARLSKVLQLTLAVIKPDAVAHPLMLEVSSNYLSYYFPLLSGILRYAYKSERHWSQIPARET